MKFKRKLLIIIITDILLLKNLASKIDIADFAKKADFEDKLK